MVSSNIFVLFNSDGSFSNKTEEELAEWYTRNQENVSTAKLMVKHNGELVPSNLGFADILNFSGDGVNVTSPDNDPGWDLRGSY